MIHWGGITCCLGATAFYLLSRRSCSRDVEILKSVPRVDQLKDLESKVFPLIIAVSGRVGSENPLKCRDIHGVILKQTVEEQFLRRNCIFSWVQDSVLMQPLSIEIPWYLDDGTGRVNISGAQDAISFPLTIGSEVFVKSESSLSIFDHLSGLKMLGVKHIERVLPIGTPLTIVGEAVKDGIGNVRVQKPEQGGPFYVSPIPLDQLIAKSEKWSMWFKYASIGLTVIGLILISKDIIENMLARRRRRRYKNISDVSEEYCVICLEEKYNTAFVPCGHMCCCVRCSSRAKKRMKKCPICRTPINEVLKIYRS